MRIQYIVCVYWCGCISIATAMRGGGGGLVYSKEYKPLSHRMRMFRQRYPGMVSIAGGIGILVVLLLLVIVLYSSPHSSHTTDSDTDTTLPQTTTTTTTRSKVDKLQQEILLLQQENQRLKAQLATTITNPTDTQRTTIIVNEFKHAWKAYKQYAWGFDDLHPISKHGTNGYHMAMTLIDSLDTMYIMGLHDEFKQARDYIQQHFDISTNRELVGVNTFEVTIRVIGGLLSTFYLSKDELFLRKAADVADVLLPAFDSPSGIPYSTVQLNTRTAINPDGSSSVSEAGTLQLEWQTLARATGKSLYDSKIDRVNEALEKVSKHKGLFSRLISPDSGQLQDSIITLGARVDSIYEYYLKQHIMSPMRNPNALQLYRDTIREIKKQLYVKDSTSGLMYIQELIHEHPSAKMDHLVCFLPGTLALGAKFVPKEEADEHMEMAKQLTDTCYRMYKLGKTGLAPEITRFEGGIHVDTGAMHNLLRPETLESLHIMHVVTKDPKYKEWGWEIFENFRKYCRIPHGGYSAISDVDDTSTQNGNLNSNNWRDHMESFFLAETMKYLFLLFSEESILPLDSWVFNTEAHPLPIWKS